MELQIDYWVKNIMTQHAEAAYPHEACGFFFGSDNGKREVTQLLPVENANTVNPNRRFAVSPKDYHRAEQFALANGLSLQGVYHSHPDHPAEPSEHDLNQALPFFSYIIVSVNEGEHGNVRSWQLNESDSFSEESITTI